MACNNSRWKAANQSKGWRIRTRRQWHLYNSWDLANCKTYF